MHARDFLIVTTMTVLLAAGVVARAETPPLPPLTTAEGAGPLPGKFVWADLFTDELDRAREFYEQLFDWELRWVTEDVGARYGIFFKDHLPVAGLVFRAAPDDEGPYGRWVHYLSVEDVEAAAAFLLERDGRVLLERRRIEQRGEFGIYAAPDGAIVGFMRASLGDPGDYQAEMGEWLWHQLFTDKVDPAAEFYQTLIDYELYARDETPETDFVLNRDGYARAGIGGLSQDSETAPTWLGFIRVEDIGVVVDHARVMGAEVLYRPDEGTELDDLAIIADPNGATLGLIRYDYPRTGEASR